MSTLERTVFEPQTIEAMARALDEACEALKVSDIEGRKAIAIRVLDLARNGIVEAESLRERLLREAHTA